MFYIWKFIVCTMYIIQLYMIYDQNGEHIKSTCQLRSMTLVARVCTKDKGYVLCIIHCEKQTPQTFTLLEGAVNTMTFDTVVFIVPHNKWEIIIKLIKYF